MEKQIRSLNFEQHKKYRNAINKGYFDTYDDDPRAWMHTFAGAYIWKNPKRVSVIECFRELLGHIPTWEDITDTNIKDLIQVLTTRYGSNTLKNRYAELKAIINDNVLEVDVKSRRYPKLLSQKGVPSQHIYLSEQEVEVIHNYYPQTEREQFVKKVFMIEALTGARNVDSLRMRRDNCNEQTDSITYISQKTKTQISLPVHRWLMQYLVDKTDLEISPQAFNDTLRGICEKCGFNEELTLYVRDQWVTGPKWIFVSSHTGRRSFATNLFIRGADPSLIAKYMGHSSPDITIKSYIVGYRQADERVLSFFKTQNDGTGVQQGT